MLDLLTNFSFLSTIKLPVHVHCAFSLSDNVLTVRGLKFQRVESSLDTSFLVPEFGNALFGLPVTFPLDVVLRRGFDKCAAPVFDATEVIRGMCFRFCLHPVSRFLFRG